MVYVPGLILALSALWFALSGETAPLFLGFAALSVWLALWVSARLKIIDRNASPYHRLAQVLLYLVWLAVEVVKANVAVIRAVLSPKRMISPAMVKVKTGGRSDLAKAMFANSITLTPGTVTVDIGQGEFLVHALHEANARPHDFTPMAERSARAAESRPGKKA